MIEKERGKRYEGEVDDRTQKKTGENRLQKLLLAVSKWKRGRERTERWRAGRGREREGERESGGGRERERGEGVV